jgi:hypothetical protein
VPNRDIIVMGASAGGLSAFNRIVKQLPEDLTLIRHFLDRLGPRALQPWAMGQCLEGHSPSHHG